MRAKSICSHFLCLSLALLCWAGSASAQTQTDVPTWQFDSKHTGVNSTETTLSLANVNNSGQFAQLFKQQVNGQVNAQPLYIGSPTLNSLPSGFKDGKSHPNGLVYVLTQAATLYAFDAGSFSPPAQGYNYQTSSCDQSGAVWCVKLVQPGNTTEVPLWQGEGPGFNTDIYPLFGGAATPVIDQTAGIIYVSSVLKETSPGGANPVQPNAPYELLLFGIDVKSGQIVKGPLVINSAPGHMVYFNGLPEGGATPCGSVSNHNPNVPNKCENDVPTGVPVGKIPFSPLHGHARPGLALSKYTDSNGTLHSQVFMAFSSHGDSTPYYGEIIGVDTSTMAVSTQWNGGGWYSANAATGNGHAGIWMGGASPAIDPATNRMYLITGNGDMQSYAGKTWAQSGNQVVGTDIVQHTLTAADNCSASQNPGKVGDPYTDMRNYGESFLGFDITGTGSQFVRCENELKLDFNDKSSYFTPAQWAAFDNGDSDLGAGGPLLFDVPDNDNPGQMKHLILGGGKAGTLYLLDRDSLSVNSKTGQAGLGGIDNSETGMTLGAGKPDYTQNTSPNNNVEAQIFGSGNSQIFNTPLYFNGYVYWDGGNAVQRRPVGWQSSSQTYIATTQAAADVSPNNSPSKTAGEFISASGTSQAIVWQVANDLRAWDATKLSSGFIFEQPSKIPSGDQCQTSTWALPIVSNGHVYFSCYQLPASTGRGVDDQGNKVAFSSAADNRPGYLVVYGLAPTTTAAPAQPMNISAKAVSSTQINVSWTPNDLSTGQFTAGYKVLRAQNSCSGTFNQTGPTLSNDASGYSDQGISPDTTYCYEIVAVNSSGTGVASGTASATTLARYTETGLIAYWPMDEGLTGGQAYTGLINDATGNGHNLTQVGELYPDTNGYLGGDMNFHGTVSDDRLDLTASKDSHFADLAFTKNQSFTLSGWFNPATLTLDSSCSHCDGQALIAKSADTGSLYGFWINTAGYWETRGPSGNLDSQTQAAVGGWTHLAVVQDGAKGTRTFYVNGQTSSSMTGPAQDASGTGDLWMGEQNVNYSSSNHTYVDGYPGLIDEVRLYNVALTASQVLNQASAEAQVLQVTSIQSHAGVAAAIVLFPNVSGVPITEPRVSPNGTYTIQFTFSQPLVNASGTPLTPSAVVKLQSGSTVQETASLDSTNTIVTVNLSGVSANQVLDLQLTGLPTISSSQPGTYDIVFDVMQGDISGDHKVDSYDVNQIQVIANGTPKISSITDPNAQYDLNLDGVVNSNDVALANSLVSSSTWTAQTDTNLAAYKTAVASSVTSGNPASFAVDNLVSAANFWQSATNATTAYFYVDLGASATVDGFNLYWNLSRGAATAYTLDACTGTVDSSGNCSSTWQAMVTESNTIDGENRTYTGLTPVTARYFRMNGTQAITSNTNAPAPFYSLEEFYIFGYYGSPTTPPATPLPTAPTLTVTSGDGQANLSWTASTNATSYNVYRGTTSGGEVKVASTASTTYPDSGLTDGATYYYQVYAVNGAGTAKSNEQTAKPLAAPAAFTLSVTSGDGQANLSWTASTNATSYDVYRGTTSGGEVKVGSATSTTYPDNGLTDGATYYYQVYAINGTATTKSNEQTAKPLAAPTAFTVSATAGDGGANLSWTASTNATSYNVYRGTTSGGEAMVGGTTSTSFADSGLTDGKTYFYQVYAINTTATTRSNEIQVTPAAAAAPPAPPANVQATAGNGTVTVSWTAVSGATSYNVYRSTVSNGESSSTPIPSGTATSYTDTGLQNGNTYYYEVVALNGSTSSGVSQQVQAVPTGSSTTSTGMPIYQINAGGGAVGNFSAEAFWTGGTTSTASGPVTVSSTDSALPQLYLSNRYGTFSYKLPGLQAGATYTVVLHFAETYAPFTKAGQRVFSINFNGNYTQNGYDIVAAAGGQNIATTLSHDVTAVADPSGGAVTVSFSPGPNGQNNPIVQGIELLTKNSSVPPPPAPINLVASPGLHRVSLVWAPGSGPMGTYNVYRSNSASTQGTLLTTKPQTQTFYLDTGLTEGVTYYYTVTSNNASGTPAASTISATTGTDATKNQAFPGTASYQIAAGNQKPAAPFTADPNNFGTNTTGSTINLAEVLSPAPPSIYQVGASAGSFAYTFSNLQVGKTYTIRLHFEELWATTVGQRVFNVAINNSPVLTNFDIYASAGGKNVGLIEQFTAVATAAGNGTGQIVVSFTSGLADKPLVEALEVY